MAAGDKKLRISWLSRVPDTVLVSIAITFTTLGAWLHYWPTIFFPHDMSQSAIQRFPLIYLLILNLLGLLQSSKLTSTWGLLLFFGVLASFVFVDRIVPAIPRDGSYNLELKMKFCLVVCAFLVQFGYGTYRNLRLGSLRKNDSQES